MMRLPLSGGPVRTTGREHPMEPVSCRSFERGPAGQSACVSGEVVDKYGNRLNDSMWYTPLLQYVGRAMRVACCYISAGRPEERSRRNYEV